MTEYMHLGSDKIRSVDTGTGRNKSYRIPQVRALIGADGMLWWTIADREELSRLLRLVTHLGKRRAVGHGRVGAWTVEPVDPWPGFPVLRPDGTPMRNLPMNFAGIGPGVVIGWGPLRFPYWDQANAIEVAQPPDVEWMGPS